jgi:ferredoxin-NADP reductase
MLITEKENQRSRRRMKTMKGGWRGEKGYIDKEKIEKYCGPQAGDKSFYLCGPPGMLSTVTATLKELGVVDSRIRLEIFSFLDWRREPCERRN